MAYMTPDQDKELAMKLMMAKRLSISLPIAKAIGLLPAAVFGVLSEVETFWMKVLSLPRDSFFPMPAYNDKFIEEGAPCTEKDYTKTIHTLKDMEIITIEKKQNPVTVEKQEVVFCRINYEVLNDYI